MNLKEHIKQLIRESLKVEDENKARIGIITKRFPQIKEALTTLLSESYIYFIKNINLVAPKPSTFEVKLVNNLSFTMQYMVKPKNFIVKIQGKKYNLSVFSENQRAIQSISELLQLSPVQEQNQTPEQSGGNNFDAGATAFNDTIGSGGGQFGEPIAPSSEIPSGVEPTPLTNPDTVGNEKEEEPDISPDELKENKKYIKKSQLKWI